jgi:ribonucleoside-diphosphate reductase beta chain
MITDKRLFYKPFEYPQAHEFMKLQQRVHWMADEVTLASDVNDFKMKLTESEVNLIGQILKSFAQTETHVEDYWSSYVSHWFPKPEIQSMAVTFGSFESIHAEAYSLLNESLGLDDFEAFMEDEEARNKIERLQQVNAGTIGEIAQSLAIFSAFTEGVNLFSSFAVLMSFQMRNLMKGMGQIVAWSVRDESLHSKAGCWLFTQLLKERPELNTIDLREKIEKACAISVELEFAFIDKVFEMGNLENLTKEQLKNFIYARANEKMVELGYKALFSVNDDLLEEIAWFGQITSGTEMQDFFALRPTSYSKSIADWSDL